MTTPLEEYRPVREIGEIVATERTAAGMVLEYLGERIEVTE